MYLVRVIPLHRKIPDGELSYLCKDELLVGTILEVPIKKSIEQALVIAVSDVTNEKTYIKSLPWKLISIEDSGKNIILQEKIVTALQDFSQYAIVTMDTIVRACFDGIVPYDKKKKNQKKDSDTLVIVSSIAKEKKMKDLAHNVATFHTFLSFFTTDSPTIKNIILDDPEDLSYYGIRYLGFDPTAFIVLLVKKLGIELTFSCQHGRLRYTEWGISQSLKHGPKNANIRILSREEEPHTKKQFPISEVIQEHIVKRFNEHKKILIVGSAKSFAPKTICGDCNAFHSCQICTNPLILVKNGRNYAKTFGIAGDYLFVCTQCRRAETALAKCRTCDSWNLMPIGYGIERIIEHIQSIIPTDRHGEIYDFSSTTSIKKIKSWQESGGIIIGPLHILHDIESCDICIIPSLGALLYNDFFESTERVRDILHYAQYCDTGMIVSVLKENERAFLEIPEDLWLKNELLDRESLQYPPYARHTIYVLDPYASKSERIQETIKKMLEKYALPDTIKMEKIVTGQVKIYASFPSAQWSIVKNDYQLAEKITTDLGPFLKYIKVEVY